MRTSQPLMPVQSISTFCGARIICAREHALQVEKSPKPVASCAMPAGPGMKIKTETPLVKKAREGVMEFLLVSCMIPALGPELVT